MREDQDSAPVPNTGYWILLSQIKVFSSDRDPIGLVPEQMILGHDYDVGWFLFFYTPASSCG